MNIKRAIRKEMKRAKSLNDWPTDIIHQAAVIAEEAGEVVQSANNFVYGAASKEKIKEEVIQTIVTCLRYLEANK